MARFTPLMGTFTKQRLGGPMPVAVSARDVRGFLEDVAVGKYASLPLKLPDSAAGCSGQTLFNGRTKSNDGALRTFSLRCDRVVMLGCMCRTINLSSSTMTGSTNNT
jgi:hypothetical protein